MKLSSRSKKILAVVAMIALLFGIVLNYMIFGTNKYAEGELTRTNGKTITVKIQSEFTKLENTLKLLEDLYEAQDEEFLQNFHLICSKLLDDDLAIGSLYFAPGGVIQYSAPEEVEASTNQFNMLEDPVQSPKALVAVESGKTTIAGPHQLIEGGTGLILRKPVYQNGTFFAIVVSVINTEDLFANVNRALTESETAYHYAVYKTDDKTATLDDNGYIYNSGDKPVSGNIVIPFEAPNDTWYLTIEPIDEIDFFSNMYALLLGTLVMYVILLIGTVLILRHQEMRQQMVGMEQEQERMEQELRYQSQLKAAMEAAQRANAAKTDFLSRMSHDIRTPINGIVGMTHIMEAEIDHKDKVLESIDKTKNLTHQLELLINDVLEMSRIESGKIVLAREVVNLPRKLHELRPAIATLAENHNVVLIDGHLNIRHETIIASPVHLQRIMMNLFTNAAKYNKDGGSIEYWVNEYPIDDAHSTYEFTIEDTGKGMSEEYMKHIFEPFSREDDSSENKQPGTGLGMAITKELVDMMGGTIEIRSQLGVGTKITVCIPMEITQEPEEKEVLASSLSLEGKHVLLVEDNTMNLEIAKFILEEEHVIIDVARNGQEAVDCFSRSQPGQYDMILMDVRMPVMNGLEATRAIRRLDRPDAKQIPIIAMTANAFQEDVQQCMQAGMNAHIAKPIDIEDMKAKIARVLG